jgi:pimeloyl-ACP methyl ester carboxylesterase
MQNSNGIRFVSVGEGRPILMLHGLMLDHRSVLPFETVFSAHAGWRRVYIDLPGMGQSPCGGIGNSDEMLAAVQGFITREIDGPFAAFGYSYGGYLAQGLLATGADLLGMGLLAPVVEPEFEDRQLPVMRVLERDEALLARLEPARRAEFEAFCVLQTEAVFAGTMAELVPGFEMMDEAFIKRLQAAYAFSFPVNPQPEPFQKPVMMVTGRQDHIVGFKDAFTLLPNYPRAQFSVLDRAGHNLQIEQRALVETLFGDWLSRMEKDL